MNSTALLIANNRRESRDQRQMGNCGWNALAGLTGKQPMEWNGIVVCFARLRLVEPAAASFSAFWIVCGEKRMIRPPNETRADKGHIG